MRGAGWRGGGQHEDGRRGADRGEPQIELEILLHEESLRNLRAGGKRDSS